MIAIVDVVDAMTRGRALKWILLQSVELHSGWSEIAAKRGESEFN